MSQDIINPATLEVMRSLEADDPGAMSRLLRLFLTDAPAQLDALEKAYDELDSERVRNSAHYLRSGALAVGADHMAEAALVVERMDPARYGDDEMEAALNGLRFAARDALMALLKLSSSL
jgi:HPt (histidine-containing phosphotransfer) domain-containing protein